MRQAEGWRTDAPPSSPFFPHTKSQRLRGKLQGKFWGGYTLNNPRTLPNPTSGTATESFQLNSVRNPSVTLARDSTGQLASPSTPHAAPETREQPVGKGLCTHAATFPKTLPSTSLQPSSTIGFSLQNYDISLSHALNTSPHLRRGGVSPRGAQ